MILVATRSCGTVEATLQFDDGGKTLHNLHESPTLHGDNNPEPSDIQGANRVFERFYSHSRSNDRAMKRRLSECLKQGSSSFGPAFPPAAKYLKTWRDGSKDQTAWPSSWLTRLMTGDVPADQIKGLGKMEATKWGCKPADGCKDVFVSSLKEYEKRGILFNPNGNNDAIVFAEALNLSENIKRRMKVHGCWLLLIHPGTKVGIPTLRGGKDSNQYFEEGGYTADGLREWVIPNTPIFKAERAGEVRVYRINTDGKTVQYKAFKDKLLPFDEWLSAIDDCVREV